MSTGEIAVDISGQSVNSNDLQSIVMRLSADEVVPLEDMLFALSRYGKPRLSLMGGGWYSAIEMRVSSVGAEFKIASDFKCKSPSAAVAECCARVYKTLSDLGSR